MKGMLMNELESAIAEWVTKNTMHGRGYIGQVFTNKGYPFNDIEEAIDRLLKHGILYLDDNYVCFKFPEEDHGGFDTQLDVPVPDYIKVVLEANAKANEEIVVPDSHKKNPAVHSPSHYTRGGIETIDFIEAKGLNFHLGNVVKYVSRAGFKQDALIQDLEKALWYLNREIKRIKTQEP